MPMRAGGGGWRLQVQVPRDNKHKTPVHQPAS
jgi:hypothetical protein